MADEVVEGTSVRLVAEVVEGISDGLVAEAVEGTSDGVVDYGVEGASDGVADEVVEGASVGEVDLGVEGASVRVADDPWAEIRAEQGISPDIPYIRTEFEIVGVLRTKPREVYTKTSYGEVMKHREYAAWTVNKAVAELPDNGSWVLFEHDWVG